MSECRSDTCGPCHAGKHERCYEPCMCHDRGHPTETLTPSDKALAKMLDAAIEWGGADVETAPIPLLNIALALRGMGLLTTQGKATDAGRDLLARAKKAGVL